MKRKRGFGFCKKYFLPIPNPELYISDFIHEKFWMKLCLTEVGLGRARLRSVNPLLQWHEYQSCHDVRDIGIRHWVCVTMSSDIRCDDQAPDNSGCWQLGPAQDTQDTGVPGAPGDHWATDHDVMSHLTSHHQVTNYLGQKYNIIHYRLIWT